jgi:hypothetical protein
MRRAKLCPVLVDRVLKFDSIPDNVARSKTQNRLHTTHDAISTRQRVDSRTIAEQERVHKLL